MSINQTFYNRYKGWGTGTQPIGNVIFIQRSRNHVLSPSPQLLTAWQNRKMNKMSWQDYTDQFLKEMESPEAKAEIKRLAELTKKENVWLICSCWNNRNECHRFLVVDLIKKEMMRGLS